MNAFTRALLLTALAAPSTLFAAAPELPRDGWVSWSVAAAPGAHRWCCFEHWQGSDTKTSACKLDGGASGHGNLHDETTDSITVYARASRGKLDRVQALAANCPVETETPVRKLDVSAEDSARWLTAVAKQDGTDAVTREPLGEGALAALAVHGGPMASDALTKFARQDSRVQTRKWAVFWLGVARGSEGADTVSHVMFNDTDAEVREHAAFALSQSKAPRAAADLVRLGNTDKVSEVRAQAWFWLAQMGAENAEQAIAAALRKDADDDVRERAVFALSQLPDERATRALIATAEDQSLPREQRKKAVFWLSQSESQTAQNYLEKVLAAAAP